MNNQYSTDIISQQRRILEWLKSKPLTTAEARTELDIFHPAGRVKELKAKGHNIHTHTEIVDTGKGKHRIAKYVLFAEGVDAGC